MGSVGGIETCTRCGQERMHTEFYYKSGEEWASCRACGYRYSLHIKRSKLGNIIMRDKSMPLTSDNMYWVEKKSTPRYGLAFILGEKGCSVCSVHNKKQLEQLSNYGANALPDGGVVAIKLTRLVKGKVQEKIIYVKDGVDAQSLCFP